MTIRKRLLRLAILLLALVGLPIVLLWLYLAQPTFAKSDASQQSVSPAALESHVRMLSETLAPRSAYHFANLDRSADYIAEQFRGINQGKLSKQKFEVDNHRYRNISLLTGDPTAKRAVVGAHYDGYGPHPAADDNASGVAGLIELAKLIAANPPGYPIEFVAFPLEEPPHFATDDMGSWRHAREMEACRFMISLEMIGYFTDERIQKYPIRLLNCFYPSQGNFIAVVGNTRDRKLIKHFKVGMKGTTTLPVYSIRAPAKLPGIDFSDHRNYWRKEFPAVMVTDTAFYRNFHYHTPEDTADRLDYEKMAAVVVGVFEALQALDK